MRLTSTDLRALADQLDALAKVSVKISTFEYVGHTITVKKQSDQREGDWMIITSIQGLGE